MDFCSPIHNSSIHPFADLQPCHLFITRHSRILICPDLVFQLSSRYSLHSYCRDQCARESDKRTAFDSQQNRILFEMEQQNEKGKHKLSPQADPAVTKKSRPTCFVETPGGSLRETDPSTDHQPSSSAMASPGSKLREASSLDDADDIEPAQSSFSGR